MSRKSVILSVILILLLITSVIGNVILFINSRDLSNKLNEKSLEIDSLEDKVEDLSKDDNLGAKPTTINPQVTDSVTGTSPATRRYVNDVIGFEMTIPMDMIVSENENGSISMLSSDNDLSITVLTDFPNACGATGAIPGAVGTTSLLNIETITTPTETLLMDGQNPPTVYTAGGKTTFICGGFFSNGSSVREILILIGNPKFDYTKIAEDPLDFNTEILPILETFENTRN